MQKIIFRCGEHVEIRQFAEEYDWEYIDGEYVDWLKKVTNGNTSYGYATNEEIELYGIAITLI